MSFFDKVRGTFETLFQLGKAGPQLKNNAGAIEARNAADSAYVNARGADPAIADDLVTKRYGDANYGGGGTSLINTVPVSTTTTVADTKQLIFHRRLVVHGTVAIRGFSQLAGHR